MQNWPHFNTDNYYAHIFANNFAHTSANNTTATTQVATEFIGRGTTVTDDCGTIGFDDGGATGKFGKFGLGFGDLAGNLGTIASNKFQNYLNFHQMNFKPPPLTSL